MEFQRLLVDAPFVTHFGIAGESLGLKPPSLVLHGENDTFNSSFYASVNRELPESGKEYLIATNPNVRVNSIKFLAFYSSNFGFFILEESGRYQWSAYKATVKRRKPKIVGRVTTYRPPVVQRGKIIPSSIEVQKVLMAYRER